MMIKNVKIKTIGFIVAVSIMLIIAVVAYEANTLRNELKGLHNFWNIFNSERSSRYHMLRQLNAELGYGGMIHHVKRYVLRQDDEYKIKAEQSISSAKSIIKNYRVLANEQEKSYLNTLSIMLDGYIKALIVTEQNIKLKTPIGTIDRQILVDDNQADRALIYLQKANLSETKEAQEQLLFSSKIRLINLLRSALGYHGVVHHYMNFIIRQEDKYLDLINYDFSRIKVAIEKYKNLKQTPQEIFAIQQIENTYLKFKSNIELIKTAIKNNLSIIEIDRIAYIDDIQTLKALEELDRSIDQQNEYQAKLVSQKIHDLQQELEQSAIFIAALLFLNFLLVTWILISGVISPILSLTKTMKLLADDQLETEVLIEAGDNEIGSMAKALKVFKEKAIVTLKDAQLIKKIIHSAGEGILGVDTKGKITFINPKALELLGCTMAEVTLKNVYKTLFYQYEDGKAYFEKDNPISFSMLQNMAVQNSSDVMWRKDNTCFPINLTVTPLLDLDKVSGAVVVFLDITEQKRAETIKTEFISTVSHELRTPLTSIRGSLGLVSGGAAGELPEKAQTLLKIASNNTERLLMLINDILDIEKIESGLMSFKFDNVSLIPLVEQSLEDNAAYADQFNVTFTLKTPDKSPIVNVDRGRILQIMANLLSNAAKFSHRNDNVDVSISLIDPDWVRIEVRDYGIGIRDSFHKQLFDKFTQSDSSDIRQKGGTGLGLNISKAIAKEHKGELGFTSKFGFGAKFYLDLPCVNEEELVLSIDQQDTENKNKPQILIVEDDKDVATLLKIMLNEIGFDCDIANGIQQAWQLIKNNEKQYKVITIDLKLSDGNGLDLLAELRSNPLTNKLPAVIISATADETKLRLNGGAIEMADWLNKPIDENRLTSVIEHLTRNNEHPHILHVEDDKDILTLVQHMLGKDCIISSAETLSAAKQKIQTEKFDLVLLDVGLPDGSGLDLLEEIKKFNTPPKVVIFSAQNVSHNCAEQVGAVLLKSQIDNEGFVTAIKNVLSENAKK